MIMFFKSTRFAYHALTCNALKKTVLESLLERPHSVTGSHLTKLGGYEPIWKVCFSSSSRSWISELKSSIGNEAGQVKLSVQKLGFKEAMRCYSKLAKIRLSGFVMSTACVGYVLGSGETVEWPGMVWTGLGTLGAAACANTLNQVGLWIFDQSLVRFRWLSSGQLPFNSPISGMTSYVVVSYNNQKPAVMILGYT